MLATRLLNLHVGAFAKHLFFIFTEKWYKLLVLVNISNVAMKNIWKKVQTILQKLCSDHLKVLPNRTQFGH